MKNPLVYIKGVRGRGEEVINMLKDCGAENPMHVTGERENLFYVIDAAGRICCIEEVTEFTRYYYRELKLPK